MMVVQSLKKMASIKTTKDLGKHFCQEIETRTKDFSEIHLVFGTYKDSSIM
jgi:hypothetical protein